MKFITFKTNDGEYKGNTAFYCKMLHVSRQGFYKYLENKDRPWKYQPLADAMMDIQAEDECNDTYGLIRMYQALLLKRPENVDIPSERTIYRIMEEIGLTHRPKRKLDGITKADREARKSDELLKRNFETEEPLTKCVTDITEIKAGNGKLYVSAIFDCFDLSVIHSDRVTQYTSQIYRNAINKYGIRQSMSSAGGRCHDNACCESMWVRMKSELLYERYPTEKMTTDELRALIWRYFMSYWKNRRICSANGGLPPMVRHRQYYDSLKKTA